MLVLKSKMTCLVLSLVYLDVMLLVGISVYFRSR
jgi:hypothetical protein